MWESRIIYKSGCYKVYILLKKRDLLDIPGIILLGIIFLFLIGCGDKVNFIDVYPKTFEIQSLKEEVQIKAMAFDKENKSIPNTRNSS